MPDESNVDKELQGLAPAAVNEPSSNPAPLGGNPESDSDEGKRTLDNVRGELLRKQRDAAAAQQTDIDQLSAQIANLTQAFNRQAGPAPSPIAPAPVPVAPVAPAATPTRNPKLASYSTEQLAGAKASGALEPVEVQQVDAEIAARNFGVPTPAPVAPVAQGVTLEDVDKHIQQRQRAEQIEGLKKKAGQQAVHDYPALANTDSNFYAQVRERLVQRRELQGATPTDILDAANEVAAQMGMKAERTPFQGTYVGQDGGGGAPKPEARQLISPEEKAHLDQIFGEAMPVDRVFDEKTKTWTRKQRPLNQERMAANRDRYGSEIHLYTGVLGRDGRKG